MDTINVMPIQDTHMKNLLVAATMLITLLAVSNIAIAERDQFNEVQDFLKHRQAKQESKHRYQQQLQAAQARREQQQAHPRQQRRTVSVPQHRQQQAPRNRQYQAPRNQLATALNNNPKCHINIQALACRHGQTFNGRCVPWSRV